MGSANFFFIVLAAAASSLAVQGADFGYYPRANLSTMWINKASLWESTFTDGTTMRVIILCPPDLPYSSQEWSFAAGFFCASPCDVFLFSVFIVKVDGDGTFDYTATGPQVVWSANRASPVRENATIELDRHGDLVLRDFDGKVVWSSGTSGKPVVGMEITKDGNLVLFAKRNATVWESFDQPTDSLVPGQTLREGMRLTANTPATNSQNQLYITVLSQGLHGYVESTPPQLYFSYALMDYKTEEGPTTASFYNGSLDISGFKNIPLPATSSSQYMRLESDGHLRLHQWSRDIYQWTSSDVMQLSGDYCDFPKICREFLNYGACAYPTVCGEYGICTNGQCTCPLQGNTNSNYFKLVDEWNAGLGCTPLTPISCQDMQHHELFTLADVSYFDKSHTIGHLNRKECMQACLKNCSCKAVVFRYDQNDSIGECFWVTKVFSLQSIKPEAVHYNSTAYLKVQLNPSNYTSAPAIAQKRQPAVVRW